MKRAAALLVFAFAALPSAQAAPRKEAAPRKAACSGKPIDKAICADQTLSALSTEVRRLDAAAGKDKASREAVAAGRNAWLAERDACGAKARDCLLEQHMARIAALRLSGSDDPKGLSAGPKVYSCEGLSEPISATTAKTKTPVAYLAWGQWAYALTGSDAGYAVELDQGPMSWTPTPSGATLAIPGRGVMACVAR
jgi:uncharacterized protein